LRPLKLDVANLPDELSKLVEIVSMAKQQAQELEETIEISVKVADISASQTQALQRLQNLEKYAGFNFCGINLNNEMFFYVKEFKKAYII
jgi:hypothetical protein